VWLQLAEMFGNAFLREHGEQPSNLWVVAINRLSDKQISTGLADLANQGLAFPPNLSQFVAASKKPTKAPHWDAPKLPAPTDQQRKENADKAWRYMEYLAGHPLNRE